MKGGNSQAILLAYRARKKHVIAHVSLHRVAWLILKCARRTSAFLSCAFREQEDDQAAPSNLTFSWDYCC